MDRYEFIFILDIEFEVLVNNQVERYRKLKKTSLGLKKETLGDTDL